MSENGRAADEPSTLRPILCRRSNGSWRFEFADEVVSQLRFDYAVSVLTEHTSVRIERDLRVRDAGRDVVVTPNEPSGASFVAALHTLALLQTVVSDAGGLHMRLAGSRELLVEPSDDAFEAFQLSVGGWSFVSTPGGGLAVFAPLKGTADIVEFQRADERSAP